MKIGVKFFLLVTLLAARPAFAYIDPGTGSMLIQMLVVAIAAMAAFFRPIWRGVTSFFHRKKEETEEQDL